MEATGHPVVEADTLWFSYGAQPPVLRGVSLVVTPGQITMVLGASGSGKTTLLKLCKGLLTPERGTIRVLGKPPRSAPRGGLDPRIAYIPQHLGLVRSLSVLDNVLTGALARVTQIPSLLRLFPREEVERARQLLERLGIAHKAEDKAYALSGGELQRVAIARALMQEARLVLADEFVSQLDVLTSREILDIARGIADEGVTFVVATHEIELVGRYADTVVVLRDGEKVIEQSPNSESVADLALSLRR